MALDMDKEIERHQKGWADFAKWSAVTTVIVSRDRRDHGSDAGIIGARLLAGYQ